MQFQSADTSARQQQQQQQQQQRPFNGLWSGKHG